MYMYVQCSPLKLNTLNMNNGFKLCEIDHSIRKKSGLGSLCVVLTAPPLPKLNYRPTLVFQKRVRWVDFGPGDLG